MPGTPAVDLADPDPASLTPLALLGTRLANTRLLADPGSCQGSCSALLAWVLWDCDFRG